MKDHLSSGESIYAPFGQFRFRMTDYGHAVIELLEQEKHDKIKATEQWSTGEYEGHSGPFKFHLTANGEAVVVDKDGVKVWSSGTAYVHRPVYLSYLSLSWL